MSVIARQFGVVNKRLLSSLTNVHLSKNVVIANSCSYLSTNSHQPASFLSGNSFQRFYSNALIEICWNCKAEKKKLFICDDCGKLQDITSEPDFFELLSLPRDFDVSPTKLTKIFRQVQTLVHPDKFGNKSEREQINAAEWSAQINKAYKTLSQPFVRGQYLLKLQGEQMPQDNSSMNTKFLMEMMERNEEVDDAEKKEDLLKIHEEIQEEINGQVLRLKEFFKLNDLSRAKEELVRMKYLLSIQNSIKTKIEKLNE